MVNLNRNKFQERQFWMKILVVLTSLIFTITLLPSSDIKAGDKQNSPIPKIIPLKISDENYIRLLGGPPETVEMHSGLVQLKPNNSVGKHNTKDYEEMVIVLEGKGEMRITGGDTLSIDKNVVLYCPPNREHDIYNTGSTPLRYIYVVAKTE